MNPPLIFNKIDQSLEEIKRACMPYRVVDTYQEQLEDLFLIRNPHHRFNKDYKEELKGFIKEHSQGKSLTSCGTWVYFPWNGILCHYLEDREHQEIRTARNRNIITKEEQEKFYDCTVGIAGLSVGSHGALTLALMGGSRMIKLADPDTISPTNLNRMRFDFTQVGLNKGEAIAQYIYQLNPYANVELYTDGITPENMDRFLEGLDILVEELDDIGMKLAMREGAKKRNLPVVMVTDNCDSVIVDIERFDLRPDLKPFYGALEGMDVEEIKSSPSKMFEAMAKIIDVSLVPPRVLHSVTEVGKTIYSWPQLASAATLSGVVIAYLVRRIALGEDVTEGKSEINLDRVLDPHYEKDKDMRDEETKKFLKAIGMP
jgi:ThiF family